MYRFKLANDVGEAPYSMSNYYIAKNACKHIKHYGLPYKFVIVVIANEQNINPRQGYWKGEA